MAKTTGFVRPHTCEAKALPTELRPHKHLLLYKKPT